MLYIKFGNDKVTVVLSGENGQPHVSIEKAYEEVEVDVSPPDSCVLEAVPMPLETVRAGQACVRAVGQARKASEGKEAK